MTNENVTRNRGVLELSTTAAANSFALVDQNAAAPIWRDEKDATVVQLAADFLSQDIKAITGVSATVSGDANSCATPRVIIGTIGQSALIDQFIAAGTLDVSSIEGEWENFLITTVDSSLVIAGSDRRGTAFGVFTLSRKIGVSPWYWWSEAAPIKQEQLHITASDYTEGTPSVKFRGLFINDEIMGPNSMHDWARLHFEAEEGRIGPKIYARVFELLLRLKANYCWPAMHPPSKWFNKNELNAELADNYAIVMGTSHCEQMLRNNMAEWDSETMGPWNYNTNRERIHDYWRERLETNKDFDNTYTVGLRGTDDSEMEGAESIADMVKITQQALNDQRQMISEIVNPDPTKVPQMLCTYKEVLLVYQNGLEVPEDITLLWVDDNHGYVRQLCTPEEQKRSGGSGVYYHLSLLGTPDGYLWLSTISPNLMAAELTKAYEYGADRIWMINVGDIKPAEKEFHFSMDLAWDINSWTPEKADGFIRHWAAETFGEDTADDIADVMRRYYLLAASGKPEHVYRLEYTQTELEQRLAECRQMAADAEAIAARIPDYQQDAYLHLILYPVKGTQLLTERMLLGRLCQINAVKGDAERVYWDSEEVEALAAELYKLDDRYNSAADEKWKRFITWQPRFHRVKPPTASYQLLTQSRNAVSELRFSLSNAALAEGATYESEKQEKLYGTREGGAATFSWDSDEEGISHLWIRTTKPTYSVSSYNVKPPTPTLQGRCNDRAWQGEIPHNGNIWHTEVSPPIWCDLGQVEITKGRNELVIDLCDPLISISDIALSMVRPLAKEHIAVFSAGDFKAKSDGVNSAITSFPGLGTGQTVAARPFTAPSLGDDQIDAAPWVEYELAMPAGASRLQIRTLPNHRAHEGRGVRYAVTINGAAPKIFDVQADEFSSEWQNNVIHGYTSRFIPWEAAQAETITVRISLLDPGLVLRELIVDQA